MTPDPKRILIIQPKPAMLAFLINVLGRAGYQVLSAPSGKEGLIEAWRNRPELIILDTSLSDVTCLELLRKIKADPRTSPAKVLVLVDNDAASIVQTLKQSGADEVVLKDARADAELLAKANAVFTNPTPAPVASMTSAPLGKLVCFLSAKGGTGTSSICANMAQILADLVKPAKVALIDLVLPIGSINQIVSETITPNQPTIVTLSQNPPERLTPEFVSRHLEPAARWKVYLLPGAPDPAAAQELQVDRLEGIINAARQSFDYVLVDFGRALSRVSLPFIRASTSVVVVVTSDKSTVALTKTTLKYLELQGVQYKRMYLVLNRPVALEGMSKVEIEQELAIKMRTLIPNLGAELSAASNMHQPLTVKSPTNTATFALQELTKDLLQRLSDKTL